MTQESTTPSMDTFSTDPSGLPAGRATETVWLDDGASFELRISPVANQVGDAVLRMLAYNDSIPGPTLRVRQGSEIQVRIRNDADHEGTVHWHGLRLDNRSDGVPYETQPPIPVGGEFSCAVRFPDEGLYWYHPHSREDYGLEMGLYGNIVVEPSDPECWPPVNRDFVVTLDDLLIEDGRIAPFSRSDLSHTAMGRFGNLMVTSGQAHLVRAVHPGEVVRFFFTNTANTRIFNVGIPGVRMKLVGGDSGRCEHERFVDAILLGPSERAVVDVHFDAPGSFSLEHRTPEQTYVLGTIRVAGEPVAPSFLAQFEQLRTCDELVAERGRLVADELGRPPDRTLTFVALMPILYGDGRDEAATSWTCPMHAEIVSAEPGTCPICGMQLVPAATSWTCPMHAEIVSAEPGTCPICGMQLVPAAAGAEPMEGGDHHHDSGDGLEWEDLMPEINRQTNATNMVWKLVDADTGKENGDIDWAFRVGDRVKIRLVNTMDSEHPMHHPFHLHGAGRFLVMTRDDEVEDNLCWKDTVLIRAGQTVDILFDVTNPGRWMAHCHIAEHNQNGMMFSFDVQAADGA